MKKILLIVLLISSINTYSQWISLDSGVGTSLKDVRCITEDIVIIVGDEGKILKTIDGGVNWGQKNSGVNSNLIKVQFLDNQIGLVLGDEGQLIKTIDGGENWTILRPAQPETFSTSLSCINEHVIYISENYELKKSIDGGINFETVHSSIGRIQFITELLGYATDDSSLVKTIDGGNTWTSLLTSDYIFDFFFFDGDNGFVNSVNGLSKTNDAGQTFNQLDIFDTNINKLYAPSSNVVWGLPVWCLLNFDPCYSIKAVISDSGLYQRTNGNLLYINSLHFANPTKGYAVGEYGLIFKNTTGLDDLSVKDVRKTKSIIYPNPASEKISISLSENTNSVCQIEIGDSVGKIVFSKSYKTGNDVEVNIRNLSKGLYFVSIIGENENMIYKLIIK